MITVHITLKNNHLSVLEIIGHADFYAIGEIQNKKNIKGLFKQHDTQTLTNTGNIPCASISILCKSFVDSIVLYAMQKNEDIKKFMTVEAKEKGSLTIQLIEPTSDPMHVYRYAIEQMLIIGIQAVAKEYKDDVSLQIES